MLTIAWLSSSWARVVVVVVLFAVAWALSRVSAAGAARVIAWYDRRHVPTDPAQTGVLLNVKRRETLVGFIRAAIAYAAFAVATLLAIAVLIGGVDRLVALAGASFAFILLGFAVQRVLMDVIAGVAMFWERWYSVGDTIIVSPLEVQGVVEEVSLRHTKLRTLEGESVHIHNSQVGAVRVLPRGMKELAVEMVVRDGEEAERIVYELESVLPQGPTAFVRVPWVEQRSAIGADLDRIRLHAGVAAGREWLVDGFYTGLLRESAREDLIVHGPVVMSVDEYAARSFARANPATRWGLVGSRG